MENIRKTLSTPFARICTYLTIFIVGAALHEVLRQLIHPTIGTNNAEAITLCTLSVFVLIGAFVANGGHFQSRVVSTATLGILGFIALRLGHSSVPDPYVTLLALAIAFAGAQNIFHRKLGNLKLTLAWSACTIIVSLIIVALFVYFMTVADRALL